MFTKIRDGNENTIAIVIPSYQTVDDIGIEFFTDPQEAAQVGIMMREEGHVIKSHTHSAVNTDILRATETLFIRSGKIKVTLHDSNHNWAVDLILEMGDTIVLVSGYHRIEFLETSEILEVKDGPHCPQNKIYLD